MDQLQTIKAELEKTRTQFLRFIEEIRLQVHIYCSRMTGSALDSEDLVQETLAQAYYKLPQLNTAAHYTPGFSPLPTINALIFYATANGYPKHRRTPCPSFPNHPRIPLNASN
jgi:hypothetical protein